ncbi:MAG TPA: carboxyl transferase domain-containing protein [Acidimicrobiia bacterium]|jgi:acetyl-CoA carboxylase carboxyltransferase component|nr:carboxyl transferase domain-containing protein [Acidimicrobiia bacterium]
MSDWQPLLDDLEARRAAARAMGGAERLAAHRRGGRLDARARLDALFDPGTFVELGTLVGSVHRGVIPPVPADGLVAGHGLIDGRPVVAGAEDFTVMGGSIGHGTAAKRQRLAELAGQERVPLVMCLEGAGARAQNAFERRGRAPNDLQTLARLSGLVPTVCLVMGASAGHGALTAPLMDLVVMVEGAALFSAGPPLVQAAIGETVTKEELGGTGIHTATSGVAHNAAADDRDALALARRYLRYFPSSAWEHPPAMPNEDAGPRAVDELVGLIPADPRRGYDVRPVVEVLCDRGSVLEIQPAYGRAVVTALASLGGVAVAVVANQPAVKAGSIDADAGDKAAHFLGVVGAFHLPVVFLADNPGVLAGTAAERSGILRHAARMFAAQARVRSPKLHVTLRKAYGFGSSLMAMNPFDDQTVSLALPGARLGAMPAAAGAEAAGVDGDTKALLEHAEVGGAYSSADTMSYDEVVAPAELREALLAALRLTAPRRRLPVEPDRHPGALP